MPGPEADLADGDASKRVEERREARARAVVPQDARPHVLAPREDAATRVDDRRDGRVACREDGGVQVLARAVRAGRAIAAVDGRGLEEEALPPLVGAPITREREAVIAARGHLNNFAGCTARAAAASLGASSPPPPPPCALLRTEMRRLVFVCLDNEREALERVQIHDLPGDG